MKTVCFIPSENGYGHLRRCIALSHAFKRIGYSTTLVWSKDESFPSNIMTQSDFSFVKFTPIPLMWDGPLVRRETMYDRDQLRNMLGFFDLVISDTLTWPLMIDERAILISQFLWEIYYAKTNKEKMPDETQRVLTLDSTRVFAMGDFVWPEMRELMNINQVPILDYWNLRKKRILFSTDICTSSSGTGRGSLSRTFLNWNCERIMGFENYIREKQTKPLGVLCRPGLGIVTECISARSIPIVLDENDFEMKYNRAVLTENLRLGVKAEELDGLSPEEATAVLLNFSANLDWPEVMSVDNFVQQLLGSDLF